MSDVTRSTGSRAVARRVRERDATRRASLGASRSPRVRSEYDRARDRATKLRRKGYPVCPCACGCATRMLRPAPRCGLCLEGLHETDETSDAATLDRVVVEGI